MGCKSSHEAPQVQGTKTACDPTETVSSDVRKMTSETPETLVTSLPLFEVICERCTDFRSVQMEGLRPGVYTVNALESVIPSS